MHDDTRAASRASMVPSTAKLRPAGLAPAPAPRGADAARSRLRSLVRMGSPDPVRTLAAPDTLEARLGALLERTAYRRVETPEAMEAVQRHRYEQYRAIGLVAERADGLFVDDLDSGRATRIYAVELEGRMAGSIRLSVLRGASREGLSARCFPDIVHPMLDAGLTLVDPNRMVTDRHLARDEPLLVFAVVRLATLASSFYSADHCLTSVRPSHGAFYRRYMSATKLSDARPFPGLTGSIALYDVHVASARKRAERDNPFHLVRPGEASRLFPMPAALGLPAEVRDLSPDAPGAAAELA